MKHVCDTFFFTSEGAVNSRRVVPLMSLPPCACFPVVLGILLTSGCATSRHCQQQELPGVRIHCCDTDLCNASPGAPRPPPGRLLLPCILAALLLS